MDTSLTPMENALDRPGPLLLVIADGFGCAPNDPSNAIAEADTPRLDELTTSKLSMELLAHGKAVGLPTDGDMGNSEVGHNALGAGRIFDQGAKLVNNAIANRSMSCDLLPLKALKKSRNVVLSELVRRGFVGEIAEHILLQSRWKYVGVSPWSWGL